MDVNVNAAACIQSATNWGETVYHNICSDTIQYVPWGTMDYVGFVLLLAFFITAIFAVVSMIFD